MKDFLFSICIPTYNSGSIVQKAIESCIHQQYENYEILIVDDHSSDNTLEVLANYKNHTGVSIYVNEKNIGMTANWNKCLKLAKGKYIAFVHHDDEVTSDYLKDASAIIRDNENIGIIAFENQRQTSSPFYGRVHSEDYFKFIFEWKYVIPPSQAIFINLPELNYNAQLNYGPEAELYIQILKANFDVYFSDKKHCIRNFGAWGFNVSTKYYYSWVCFSDRIQLLKKWQQDPWLNQQIIYMGLKTTAIQIYERRARAIALRINKHADPLIGKYIAALRENHWFGINSSQQLQIRMVGTAFFVKKFITSFLYKLIKK